MRQHHRRGHGTAGILTLGLLLVALLLSPAACHAAGLCTVAEVALPLLGVRLQRRVARAAGWRVRAVRHGPVVAVRADVVVVLVHLVGPSQRLSDLLLRLAVGGRGRRLVVVTPVFPVAVPRIPALALFARRLVAIGVGAMLARRRPVSITWLCWVVLGCRVWRPVLSGGRFSPRW